MKRRMILGLLAVVAFLAIGCGVVRPTVVTPSATVTSITRDAAIAKARLAAQQSAPELEMLDARIDSVQAELFPMAALAWRELGQDEGAAVDGAVWLVRVRGYFRYEGMAMPGGRPAIEETDERDFLISARSGDILGSSHRGRPTARIGVLA